MSWWLIALLALVAVIIAGFIYGVIASYRYTNRCLALMRTDTFMTPCQVASEHYMKHGLFSNWEIDQSMLHMLFPKMERDKFLIGQECALGGGCECTRAYCLSLNPPRKRRGAQSQFKATEVPEGKTA